jgi:colanic acid biosynthesis glycosyl transferase WcaI
MSPSDTPLSVLLHDYGRYPFSLALARALVERGHAVRYVFASRNSTPPILGGQVEPGAPGLTIAPLATSLGLTKNNFGLRWLQEGEYAVRLAQSLSRVPTDIVLSANAPLDVQARLLRAAHTAGVPFVYWLQDLIGEATLAVLSSQLSIVGELVGRRYQRLEMQLLRLSDAVVPISRLFLPTLSGAGVDTDRVEIIENWADLQAIRPQPRANAWGRAHDLDHGLNFLYAGTLGYKHPGTLLVELAAGLAGEAEARVVVISEGPQATQLERLARVRSLAGLRVLGFQPEADFPWVLGSGDVMLAILTGDAGRYSVPSKILAYLCAGRPILLSGDADNPAAQLITEAGAGYVVPAGNAEALAERAVWLSRHPAERADMGLRGRSFAEQRFPLDPIIDRFEALLRATVDRGRERQS